MSATEIVHGTVVAIGSLGVLIRGASGTGKSALALALIDGPSDPATLVADDRVVLRKGKDRILAAPPPRLAGLIEARGIGILRRPHLADIALALVVDIRPAEECPRLPDESDREITILGLAVPRLSLPQGAGDGPLRVRLALAEWGQRRSQTRAAAP